MLVAKKCTAHNCTSPVVARGLCQTHYRRWKRHGDVAPTRPIDWGAREKHPLYGTWNSLRRNRRAQLCAEWVADFWAFVRDVQTKPKRKRVQLEALRKDVALGPGNWYWRKPSLPRKKQESKTAYMRRYQRAKRAADPDYGRNQHFKQHYGVTLEWYEQRLKEQGGVCAICKQESRLVIKGRKVRLAVDHCHGTKVPRGLLCDRCNRALGLLDHSQATLRQAIAYLQPQSDVND